MTLQLTLFQYARFAKTKWNLEQIISVGNVNGDQNYNVRFA